jgi:hypothetical protein
MTAKKREGARWLLAAAAGSRSSSSDDGSSLLKEPIRGGPPDVTVIDVGILMNRSTSMAAVDGNNQKEASSRKRGEHAEERDGGIRDLHSNHAVIEGTNARRIDSLSLSFRSHGP